MQSKIMIIFNFVNKCRIQDSIFLEKIRFENSLSDALKHRLFCLDLVSAISIYVYTQCEAIKEKTYNFFITNGCIGDIDNDTK